MTTYRIDESIVKTENATQLWDEEEDWNGQNHISRATGSQWHHQTLYRSRSGRYWLEHRSQWQGSQPYAEWVSNEEAARWLLLNEHTIPDDLESAAATVEE